MMKKLYAIALVLTILGLARCGYRFAGGVAASLRQRYGHPSG